MVLEPVYLTPEGFLRLREELRYLIEVRRPEVAALIADAKAAGDVMENAAYEEAKDQQAFVEARIRHLEDLIARAHIIEPSGVSGEVSIGSRVTVAEDGQPPEEFHLVGSVEADPSAGRISNESPLGRALLGKRPGEVARVETPDGRAVEFRILRVQ